MRTTTSNMRRRDVIAPGVPTPEGVPVGRKRIAVIGIDRYVNWPALSNAVRDAKGALRLFEHLGFEPVGEPMLDNAATGAAIQAFVTDELMALGPHDSLVLFFAGHGGTRSHWIDGEQLKTGYLIPADAAHGEKVATWIDLDDWLRKVARLPPRHILVILDACFAGIALTPVAKWRHSGTFQDASLASLQARRSRRIITSALDDQVALDSGPVPGHSLFTGCLIEAFQHGQLGRGCSVATGTEIGLHMQQRVRSYPGSRQTPDFGTFEHDDRGEMVIPVPTESFDPAVVAAQPARMESLPIATVSGPVHDAGRHNVGTRSRARWIVAAVAFASIVLGTSLVVMSSFVAEPSLAAEPPARAAEPRDTAAAPATGAAVTDAGTPDDSDASGSSTASATPTSGSGSAATAKSRVPPSTASAATAQVRIIPPSRSGTATVVGSGGQVPDDTARNASSSTPSTPSPTESPVAKPRVRGPSNRRLKPSVDERNCPVKGSQDVTIDSFPPGATIYINHRDCGELGKTPWKGKLPTSTGTATGTFTAILERTGEQPVTKEFLILKTPRIQRVQVWMPPKQ